MPRRLTAGQANFAARPSGSRGNVLISNDSDFGIDGVSNSAPPYTLHEKVSPTTGRQDNGEYLVIDMTGVSATSTAATSMATVTIHVS